MNYVIDKTEFAAESNLVIVKHPIHIRNGAEIVFISWIWLFQLGA